jgi:hypothetical protein
MRASRTRPYPSRIINIVQFGDRGQPSDSVFSTQACRVHQPTREGSMRLVRLTVAPLTLTAVLACGGGNTEPQADETAPGADRTEKTATLETGANLLQSKAPVEEISMYLNGFHAAKDDAQMQMESHHYCDQVNEEFAQCVLYDGNTADARIHGLEYIISERLYSTLPADEKAYWHPHNYEILSGTLRMPGLPDLAEKEALKGKMNSYGKTWHVWMTGMDGRKPDALPIGPPHLAWSFNRDGEANQAMVDERDKRFGFNSADERQDRQDLVPMAKPQGGVDAIAAHFPNARPIPGVRDNGDAATRAVPTTGMSNPVPARR